MLALLVLGGPAAASTNVAARQLADDARLLDTCMTDVGPGEETVCIGRIADPCIEEPEGQTTVGMSECMMREHAAWDVLLNRVYREALANVDPPARTPLRNAQRQWIAGLEADIGIFRQSSGTIQQINAASHRMRQTAYRTIFLRTL